MSPTASGRSGQHVLRFGVIGSPVAHSKSPVMHAAAFAALGLEHTYEKLETSADELPARIAELRAGTFAGFNVTVPHKVSVLSLVDRVDPSASSVGAVNTLVRSPGGEISGFNTDAPALERELALLAGGPEVFRGKTALVLGTGGAARAADAALRSLGVAKIVTRGRSGDADPLARPAREAADLVAIVQATSCGMHGGPPGDIVANAVAWSSLAPNAIAYDVVYTPRETPFLVAARSHGLRATGGLGMLARQGALALELWLDEAAPFDVMLAAISARSAP